MRWYNGRRVQEKKKKKRRKIEDMLPQTEKIQGVFRAGLNRDNFHT